MRKILMINSDRRQLQAITQQLSNWGFDVLPEPDPHRTFEDIITFHPDVMVVDLILHDHNGGALSHQVKCNPLFRDLPVILLSDYELETRYPSKFGCDVVLQKAAGLSKLVGTIHRLTGDLSFSGH